MAAEGIFFGSATEFLPGIFAGIIAAATLSAIMSTVDSQLLVAGAALSHDLGIRKLFPGRDVLVSRLCIAAMCAASIGVTLLLPSSIFSRVLFALVALGAAFGPVVVARSIGWRPSAAGTIAAMLAGFLCSVVLTFILAEKPGRGMVNNNALWRRLAGPGWRQIGNPQGESRPQDSSRFSPRMITASAAQAKKTRLGQMTFSRNAARAPG